MKANKNQYLASVEIYNKNGKSGVIDYANSIGIDEYGFCSECEDDTPLCDDGSCFVCGSSPWWDLESNDQQDQG